MTVGEAATHDQVWDENDVDYDDSTGVFICQYCPKSSYNESDILHHLRSGVHEVHRYHCSQCSKKFKTMEQLGRHYEGTGHSPPQQRLASVSFCLLAQSINCSFHLRLFLPAKSMF